MSEQYINTEVSVSYKGAYLILPLIKTAVRFFLWFFQSSQAADDVVFLLLLNLHSDTGIVCAGHGRQSTHMRQLLAPPTPPVNWRKFWDCDALAGGGAGVLKASPAPTILVRAIATNPARCAFICTIPQKKVRSS